MNEQTLIPEHQARKAPWYRGTRVIWGATGGAVVALVALGATALSLDIDNLDRRLFRLESQDNTVATADALSRLQTDIQSLQAGLTDNQQRVIALQKQLDSQVSHVSEMEKLDQTTASLQQALQTQENWLKALNDQLNALKAKPAAATEEKTSATEKKQLPVKPRVATPVISVARHAPFVLTGVEKRGSESWAAVAPRGYSSLSQIALIGQGETVSGWTMVHAGYGEATFRVNGRLTVLRVE
jgi:hypothetical protein